MTAYLLNPLEAEQGSAEWLAARCGKITCSRLRDVLATLKNGDPAAARNDYLGELAVERITGQTFRHFENEAMRHGTACEPLAREAYEIETGNIVEEVGFVPHPTLPLGGSPDGLVGDDGIVEIKCPWDSRRHLATIVNGMPSEHMAQVQGVMLVTGRQWCDFISFDPRLPERVRLYVQRVLLDEAWSAKITAAVSRLELDLVDYLTAVDPGQKWTTPTRKDEA